VLADFQLNMGESGHDSGLKDGMDDMSTGKNLNKAFGETKGLHSLGINLQSLTEFNLKSVKL